MQTDLIAYYRERANEYEKIYSKPERQSDIDNLGRYIQNEFYKKEVLEIACGTGFWTERISKTAAKIVATDINNSVIEIARRKDYKSEVAFLVDDIFNSTVNIQFESLFGGFIWSHIKLEELELFLSSVNERVKPGGIIIFADNNYVEGSSTMLTEKDTQGNTYQARSLEDGTQHRVLKNFPTESFVRLVLKEIASDVQFIDFKYFWLVKYQSRK